MAGCGQSIRFDKCKVLAVILAAAVLASQLDSYFASYANRGALAVAVVREGRVEAVRTYGAKSDAGFRVASLSKVVTAYAIIKSGADLDAPTQYGGVTLRQLLTHTSGIDDAFFGNSVPIAQRVTLAEHFRKRPPRFGRRAGEVVVYSNEGIALAGHLLETPNESFETIVQRTVFTPLGMTRSTFVQPPPFEVVPSGEEHARLVQAPAGAMVSTAADMARLMLALLPEVREKRFAMFEYGGAFFHTGRSGHESVLYLNPDKRLGLFLVHTGGLGAHLRRNFVRDFGGWSPPQPSNPKIEPGLYRPILFPKYRIERVANLGADTRVKASGNRINVSFPPFAIGELTTFDRGVSRNGFVLTGGGNRFTLRGPLFEPVTFERIRISGTVKLIAAAVAFLLMLIGGKRFAVVALLFLLAPVAFLANYLPRAPETRPFHVESSVHLAVALLIVASLAALATIYVPWKTRKMRHVIASTAAVGIAIFVLSLLVPIDPF